MVNKMYEDLLNLKIEDNSESDNSDSSSNNTVIEAEKTQEILPIPGGQLYNINHPPGMESALKLNSSTGTEESSTPPQTLSRKQKYEYG